MMDPNEQLIIAARNNNLKKVKRAIEDGAYINVQYGGLGFSSLHWAVLNGNLKMIKFLLDNNANINKRNREKNTPLDECVLTVTDVDKVKTIISLFCDRGYDINMQDDKGNTILHKIVMHQDQDIPPKYLDNIVEYMNNEYNVNFFIVNKANESPLDLAIAYKCDAVARVFLRYMIQNNVELEKPEKLTEDLIEYWDKCKKQVILMNKKISTLNFTFLDFVKTKDDVELNKRLNEIKNLIGKNTENPGLINEKIMLIMKALRCDEFSEYNSQIHNTIYKAYKLAPVINDFNSALQNAFFGDCHVYTVTSRINESIGNDHEARRNFINAVNFENQKPSTELIANCQSKRHLKEIEQQNGSKKQRF